MNFVSSAEHQKLVNSGYRCEGDKYVYWGSRVYNEVTYSKDSATKDHELYRQVWNCFTAVMACVCDCPSQTSNEVATAGIIKGCLLNKDQTNRLFSEDLDKMGINLSTLENSMESFLEDKEVQRCGNHSFLLVNYPISGCSGFIFFKEGNTWEPEFKVVYKQESGTSVNETTLQVAAQAYCEESRESLQDQSIVIQDRGFLRSSR